MIRVATINDCNAIQHIYNEHIKSANVSMENPKELAEIKTWINKYVNREGLFVYDDNGEVKGWAVLKKYSNRCGYRFACETSIYVSKICINQGVGKKLKQFLINLAINYDYNHMTAKIFASNTNSINFFKKFGYSVVGKQHKIGYVNNKWVDMIIMEKLLHNEKN